jgi:hypothetical protein
VAKPEEETPLHRLAMTAAGAGGTALAGSFLVHEGWAPKTISTALAAVGAGLAWKGDTDTVRNIGTGVISAAGSQLALMLIDDPKRERACSPCRSSPRVFVSAGRAPTASLEDCCTPTSADACSFLSLRSIATSNRTSRSPSHGEPRQASQS